MLGHEERSLLNWITANEYSGCGAIIDAGAFLGASAFCLASGLRANHLPAKPIHSYDYFRALDDYVAKDINEKIRQTKIGDDYLDIFQANTKPYEDLIEIHAGNFLDQKWSGEPVEILFIDIAKTNDLNNHLMREFFPRLIPEKSIVIQQDFYHCWHPYIHASMEALREHFTIVDPLADFSRIYRLNKSISPDDIERVIELIGTDELSLLNLFVSRESGKMRAMAEVIRLWHLLGKNELELFDQGMENLREVHGQSNELWSTQACQLKAIRENR
jgi:hypothetical protein